MTPTGTVIDRRRWSKDNFMDSDTCGKEWVDASGGPVIHAGSYTSKRTPNLEELGVTDNTRIDGPIRGELPIPGIWEIPFFRTWG